MELLSDKQMNGLLVLGRFFYFFFHFRDREVEERKERRGKRTGEESLQDKCGERERE